MGPRAKALAADMPHLGIPYRKVTDLPQTAFGLEVTAERDADALGDRSLLGRCASRTNG